MNGWGLGEEGIANPSKSTTRGVMAALWGVGVNEYWTSCIEIGRLKGRAYHIGGSSGLLGC